MHPQSSASRERKGSSCLAQPAAGLGITAGTPAVSVLSRRHPLHCGMPGWLPAPPCPSAQTHAPQGVRVTSHFESAPSGHAAARTVLYCIDKFTTQSAGDAVMGQRCSSDKYSSIQQGTFEVCLCDIVPVILCQHCCWLSKSFPQRHLLPRFKRAQIIRDSAAAVYFIWACNFRGPQGVLILHGRSVLSCLGNTRNDDTASKPMSAPTPLFVQKDSASIASFTKYRTDKDSLQQILC